MEANRKIARVLAHEQNIAHYQDLLRTKLSDVEMRFIERRMSEERFAIEMLRFMSRDELPPRSRQTAV
ncbi:hypothetical protein JQ615_23170 [Bradyrhizobium jicamae]|uniref:Uncharacterized protein n=1 Tax=Bradyrhizobium jicamae TaxID=280332 RepID=A0ABS5FNB0_9BRAD|nr:hypothetical protein [Bradyrhizobium jicamae]MBR0798291.1 hypothetical protein [Bradyrhizobium jicamae]MBR0938180.1 hypothetical protein [Bradyrhizobium jicamae]